MITGCLILLYMKGYMSSKKVSTPISTKPVINPALPKVSITLNGKDFTLQYDFNAIARAEELIGINLFGTFDFTQLSVTKFRAMLFSSLLKNHPEITLEECGDLITAHTLAEITIKMVEAWHGSRPEVVKDDDKVGNVKAGVAEQLELKLS